MITFAVLKLEIFEVKKSTLLRHFFKGVIGDGFFSPPLMVFPCNVFFSFVKSFLEYGFFTPRLGGVTGHPFFILPYVCSGCH